MPKPRLDRQMERYYGSYFGREDEEKRQLQELAEKVSTEIANKINTNNQIKGNTVIIQNLNVQINYASGGGATVNVGK